MSHVQIDRRQLAKAVAIVAGMVVAAGVMWAFGQQFALLRRMQIEEARLDGVVAESRARHEELTSRLAYVRSDEYIEYWARVEARMARHGEVVIVPIATTPTPQPVEPAEQTEGEQEQAPVPLWNRAWEAVFGPR